MVKFASDIQLPIEFMITSPVNRTNLAIVHYTPLCKALSNHILAACFTNQIPKEK